MTTYLMAAAAMAFILAALLLREKVRRTEMIEEAEALRGQVKSLRTIMQNDREDYARAYNTLHEAGYTDRGNRLWTPPKDHYLQQVETAQLREDLRALVKRKWELEDKVKALSATITALNEALADSRPNRSLSDDWPPYGHGIEAEAKAGGES